MSFAAFSDAGDQPVPCLPSEAQVGRLPRHHFGPWMSLAFDALLRKGHSGKHGLTVTLCPGQSAEAKDLPEAASSAMKDVSSMIRALGTQKILYHERWKKHGNMGTSWKMIEQNCDWEKCGVRIGGKT